MAWRRTRARVSLMALAPHFPQQTSARRDWTHRPPCCLMSSSKSIRSMGSTYGNVHDGFDGYYASRSRRFFMQLPSRSSMRKAVALRAPSPSAFGRRGATPLEPPPGSPRPLRCAPRSSPPRQPPNRPAPDSQTVIATNGIRQSSSAGHDTYVVRDEPPSRSLHTLPYASTQVRPSKQPWLTGPLLLQEPRF